MANYIHCWYRVPKSMFSERAAAKTVVAIMPHSITEVCLKSCSGSVAYKLNIVIMIIVFITPKVAKCS